MTDLLAVVGYLLIGMAVTLLTNRYFKYPVFTKRDSDLIGSVASVFMWPYVVVLFVLTWEAVR